MTNPYYELAIDLLTHCDLRMDQAKTIVAFLDDQALLDYDTLKEYYLEDE
jgi:hypothetical protein